MDIYGLMKITLKPQNDKLDREPWRDDLLKCYDHYLATLWNIAGGHLPAAVSSARGFTDSALQIDRKRAQPAPAPSASDLAGMVALLDDLPADLPEAKMESAQVRMLAEHFLPAMIKFLEGTGYWPVHPRVERDSWQREVAVSQRVALRLGADKHPLNWAVLKTLAHAVRWQRRLDCDQASPEDIDFAFNVQGELRHKWMDDIIVERCPICGEYRACYKVDPDTWQGDTIAVVTFVCPDCGLIIEESQRVLVEEFTAGCLPPKSVREYVDEVGLEEERAYDERKRLEAARPELIANQTIK